MRKLSIILATAAFFATPIIAYATPVSWDFSSNILQPLLSGSSALVKADHFQATSTMASIFPYASTTAVSSSLLTSGNCVQASTGGLLTTIASPCSTTSGTVTQINTSFPILGGPITTTGTLTFGGLGTSTAAVIGNIPYFSGVNTFANVATTSVSSGTGITFTGTAGALVGGSNLTITNNSPLSGLTTSFPLSFSNPSLSWIGLATSTNLVQGQIVYSTGVNTVGQIATSTLSASSPLTGSFTHVGASGSLGCQVASGSQAGCLSTADWTTFNGKQTAGNYITALTGDITASGPGSAAATLATVNSNVGSFTNANITVNAKGLITAAANGSGGGITGSGSSGRVTYWNGASSVTSSGDFLFASGVLTLGQTGGVEQGSVTLAGNTGGSATIRPDTAASGTYTLTLPAASGTLCLTTTCVGTVTSVSNSDGTLTISPTTGAVVASIALAHANTWTGLQTFNATSISALFGNNVGIGTTTPLGNYQLNIASSTGQQLVLSDGTATDPGWAMRNAGGTLFIGTTTPATGATSTVSGIQITSSGTTNVGIATTTSTWTLAVNGTVALQNLGVAAGTVHGICMDATNKQLEENTGASCTVSSERFKHDIQPLAMNATAMVMSMKPDSFIYNGATSTMYGFVAEDMASLDTNLVGFDDEGRVNSIDDIGVQAIVVKALQEQEQRIDSLQTSATGTMEDNWQWIIIIILALGMAYQQLQIKRLRI